MKKSTKLFNASGLILQERAFYEWFNKNHPLDWWAKERKGIPLNHLDRLLVAQLCRESWLGAVLAQAERSI